MGNKTLALALITTALVGCKTTQPGVEVRVVEKIVEVPAPCPGTPPERPAPLGPLANDLRAALAQTLAKLTEYSGEGQFADKALAYFEVCPPSE